MSMLEIPTYYFYCEFAARSVCAFFALTKFLSCHFLFFRANLAIKLSYNHLYISNLFRAIFSTKTFLIYFIVLVSDTEDSW